jgi:hypothetical protein
MGFFLIMCWTIPTGLFVSLTINDNALPINDYSNNNSNSNGRIVIFKSIFDYIMKLIENISSISLTSLRGMKKK